MFSSRIIQCTDELLDERVSEDYKAQPLAQDWARVSKVIEELGEAIAELISYTGQNPRKPRITDARHHVLQELADTAFTAMLAIQHFTKDISETNIYMMNAQEKIHSRLCPELWLSLGTPIFSPAET